MDKNGEGGEEDVKGNWLWIGGSVRVKWATRYEWMNLGIGTRELEGVLEVLQKGEGSEGNWISFSSRVRWGEDKGDWRNW